MRTWLAAAFCLLCLAGLPAAAAAPAVEAGRLLVARQELSDPRFRETVVLLVQHGPGGTAGLILSRPSRLSLAEALPDLPALAGREATLSYGGPVEPRRLLVMVKTADEPPDPARKILDTVYLTGPEELAVWLEGGHPDAEYRVFSGYAGWAPGQLAGEVSRGDWQVLPADAGVLFAPDVAGVWQKLVTGSERPDR